ncbi:MAG: ester cyclase [Chloroflexi bacterium]|nr:MAG: ester cyclase [Chloroflexota bacterium]
MHLPPRSPSTRRIMADLSVETVYSASGRACPTGRAVKQHQMHLFRIVAGEITEHRAVRDDLGLMAQLGLMEADAPPEDDISRSGPDPSPGQMQPGRT